MRSRNGNSKPPTSSDSVPDSAEREQLARRLEQERTKMEEQTLEIAAFGTISSGKSSLLNALIGRPVFVTDLAGEPRHSGMNRCGRGKVKFWLVDTPGLGEMHGADRAAPRLNRHVPQT